jgi:hypothetical protein
MQRFDLVDSQTASAYPGHVIVVAGDDVRITGELAVRGQPHQSEAEPLEAAIQHALLVRQRDACQLQCKTIRDCGLQGSENSFPGRHSDACRRRLRRTGLPDVRQ